MILNVAYASGRRLYHILEDAKRAARQPFVRTLRRWPWYRRRSGLPSNEVLTTAAYVAESTGGCEGQGRRFVWLDEARLTHADPARPDGGWTAGGPAPFVALLHGARLVGRGVAVITDDDRVLSDVTIHLNGRLEDHGVMRRCWLPRVAYVPGTTAILSAPGGNTYYHWLFDVLPRLHLIRSAGYDLGDIDHVVVNSTRAAFQRETLARLGVDAGRVVSSDTHRHIRCETMILPSFPGESGRPRPWVLDFLNHALGPDDAGAALARAATPRRLYVTRQKAATRRLYNHDDVWRVLERFGFIAVELETISVAEQARLFRGADVVAGVHGSGLANLVFCRPGTRLLELHAPNEQPAYYESLSRVAGVRYAAIVGRQPTDPHRAQDVVIDPHAVERALVSLLAGPPPSRDATGRQA